MESEFSFTIGSASSVRYVLEKHPGQKLLYLTSDDRPGNYLLLDVFDTHRVFSADLTYQTYYDNGTTDTSWNAPFFEFRYITLNKEEQKIFSALLNKWEDQTMRPAGLSRTLVGYKKKHNFQYLMINVWEDRTSFFDWMKDPDNQMRQFTFEGGPGSIIRTYDQITKAEIIRLVNAKPSHEE